LETFEIQTKTKRLPKFISTGLNTQQSSEVYSLRPKRPRKQSSRYLI